MSEENVKDQPIEDEDHLERVRKISKGIYIGVWVIVGITVVKKLSKRPINNYYIIQEPIDRLYGDRRPW